jgi:hypothetical protein
MNRTRIVVPTLLVAALTVLAGRAALAQPASSDAQGGQAELTAAQAITIAETMGKGRATRAKLDRDGSQAVYKIDVHTPEQGTVTMEIAAAGGRLLSTERDEEDRAHDGRLAAPPASTSVTAAK